MWIDVLTVNFPQAVREILDAATNSPDAPPEDSRKATRGAGKKDDPGWDLEDIYLLGVRKYGLPSNYMGSIIDPRLYTPSSYRYACPVAVGPVGPASGRCATITAKLASVEFFHQLHFQEKNPGEREDCVTLTLRDQDIDSKLKRATFFNFYPECIHRRDLGPEGVVINRSLKLGDIENLHSLADFLSKTYLRSIMVDYVNRDIRR